MKYGSSTIELKENGIGIYDFNSCPDEVRLKKGSVKGISQLFTDYANHSAFAHLKDLRLQKAKELLLHTDSSITEIAGEVGWTNASKFTASFKLRFGLTPQDFRKENKLLDCFCFSVTGRIQKESGS